MLAKTRGERAGAKDHWTKSRELFAKIGMPRDVKMMESLLADLQPVSKASP